MRQEIYLPFWEYLTKTSEKYYVAPLIKNRCGGK